MIFWILQRQLYADTWWHTWRLHIDMDVHVFEWCVHVLFDNVWIFGLADASGILVVIRREAMLKWKMMFGIWSWNDFRGSDCSSWLICIQHFLCTCQDSTCRFFGASNGWYFLAEKWWVSLMTPYVWGAQHQLNDLVYEIVFVWAVRIFWTLQVCFQRTLMLGMPKRPDGPIMRSHWSYLFYSSTINLQNHVTK